MAQQNNNTDTEEISLKDIIVKTRKFWQFLLQKWLFLLLCGLIGGALGFAYSMIKKPIYTATTTFVLEEGDKTSALGGLGGLASMAGIDLGGGGGLFQGDNIIGLKKARGQ